MLDNGGPPFGLRAREPLNKVLAEEVQVVCLHTA